METLAVNGWPRVTKHVSSLMHCLMLETQSDPWEEEAGRDGGEAVWVHC